MAEFTVSYAYTLAKEFSKEKNEKQESLKFEGTAEEADILGILVAEKVKLQVYMDALNNGTIPKEDGQIYAQLSEAMIERAKSKMDNGVTEANQALIVSYIAIVEELLEYLQGMLAE